MRIPVISAAGDERVPNLNQLCTIVGSQKPQLRTETVNVLMTGPANDAAMLQKRALFITELRLRGIWPT